jgi:hypothetical protein
VLERGRQDAPKKNKKSPKKGLTTRAFDGIMSTENRKGTEKNEKDF